MTEIEILKQQVAALKELIALKDQIITAINYRTQVQSVQYQPFIQQTPFSPQPYQPTITCETPLSGGAGGGGSSGNIAGTTYTVKAFT